MTEHPVRLLRRHALDAAESMENAKTLRDKAFFRGEMFGLCKALSIITTPDAPVGFATAGFIPKLGTQGERALRDFLGTKAEALLGPEKN